ncbi:MAG: hypothetical protein AB7O91_10380 [Sphingomonas sp.]
MALFFADLVREACWGEGPGALTLGGALPGHRAFADAVPAGARFHYAIAGVTHAGEWETGTGEIAAGKLARTPIASSAGGIAVDFSAGLKTVALTVCAAWFAARDGAVAAIGDVVGLADALAAKAPLDHAHDFASLDDRPTTLAGYGITDAAASGHSHGADYQPIDAGLTAIAGLTTTDFGRAHLTLADAAALRDHGGMGSLAVQSAAAVAITGGAITGITDLAIADGGTGASSASAARTNLGLGTIATQAASNVAVSGGSIGGLSTLSVTGLGGFTIGSVAGVNRIDCTGGSFYFLGSGNGYAPIRTGSLTVTGTISIGGSQIAGARRLGWTSPSGTAARSGFDTASATTEALAQRLKALIDDLIAHGLIGA